MKRSDLFSTKKNTATSLKQEHDIAKNASAKSYRDIQKRNPILSLVKKAFDTKKSYTPFSLRKHIHGFSETGAKYLKSLTYGHWILVLVLVLLAYMVYGVGFILRTESHLRELRNDPGSIMSPAGFLHLREMRRDFQILAPLIRNPIIPIEPFATYGRALDYSYRLAGRFSTLKILESDLMLWREYSNTESIFPILDDFFRWAESLRPDLKGLQNILKSETIGVDMGGFFTLWNNFLGNINTWYTLAGRDAPTRILLLNQNSDELRAGGGFPGTAFIIEFDGGRMTRFEFKDIYALDWQLVGYRLSPEGINQFKSLNYPGKSVEFEIRDANYYPRFHDSAVKLNELAEEAGIGKLDLVLGINQKFLEDIVRLVEPLKVPGIQIPIDHNNVALVLSMLVEGKKVLADIGTQEKVEEAPFLKGDTRDSGEGDLLNKNQINPPSSQSSDTSFKKEVTGTPKGTVKILADQLLQELQKKGKMDEAGVILASHIYHGEVVAGSPRTDIQSALDSLGIFDRWQTLRGDWVYPIFTSISQNKSDRLMERTFRINQIGTCERTLTLEQKHWYDLIEAARIQNLAHELGLMDQLKTLQTVQGGGDNVQYLRFILPFGTKILTKSDPNFRIQPTPDNSFTTIHGYETTRPGTTQSMTIHYLLPEGYCDDRTEFFKQPGLRNTRVEFLRNGQYAGQRFYE